jgi:hypothetical protein
MAESTGNILKIQNKTNSHTSLSISKELYLKKNTDRPSITKNNN